MEKTDVVIIGSGPSGTMASIEAVKRGADVIILENDPVVGDPNHCSGLIGVKGLKKLNVPYSNSIIENSVNAVNFYSPSNHKLTIERSNKDEIRVFQRNELDRTLYNYATDKFDVEGRLNSRVTNLIKKNGKISGVNVKPKGNKSYEIKSKIVIDASGSMAKFVSHAGLNPPDPKWRLPAMQFELDNVYDFPKNFVELYHGRKWAPGFFAWIIPTCGGSVRIGLATWRNKGLNTKKLLEKFLLKHPVASDILKDSKITKIRGGIVTASGPMKLSNSPGYLAVGDVAGQVKATTGGGVNIGGFCGRIAGKNAGDFLKDQKNNSLQNYDKEWKRLFYKELKGMELYRKVIGRVNDKTLDQLFYALSNSNFPRFLKETEDIDMHTFDLIKAGLKSLRPSVLVSGIKASPQLSLRFLQQII